MLISDVYHKEPSTIHQDKTVAEAVIMLLKEKFNGLVVVDNDKNVTGILSLQDIAGAVVPQEFEDNVNMASAMYKQGFFEQMCKEVQHKKISDIMRKDFIKVSLEDNILAVTADFLKNDLYIVPVFEHKKLIGIVTRSEIKQALAIGMEITH
jgi:DeoR family transcriptional regulator, catabolite repression regulator